MNGAEAEIRHAMMNFPDAEAYAEALDGAERKLLLAWIASHHPEVLAAAVHGVAQWRAGAAEHRRQVRNRHSKDRRRRKRAEARGES